MPVVLYVITLFKISNKFSNVHNVKPKLGSINKSLDNLEINLHSKSYFNVVVCDALFDCEPGHICEGGQCVRKYLSF